MGTIGFSADVKGWQYALNQADVIVTYLTQSFVPRALIFDYGFPNVQITVSSVAIQIVFAGSAVLLAIVSLRKLPGFTFAVFWFCTTLATTSSVIPIVNEVGANRRMYLPLLSLVYIAAVVIRQLFVSSFEEKVRSHRKWVVGVCGVLIVATLVWLTRSRNEDYRSKIRLWHSAIKVRPTNPRAHINLATALIDDQQLKRAAIHLRRAQDIMTSWDVAPRQCYAAAYYNMGHVLTKMGNYKAAIVQSQQAVEISPDDAVALYHLGNALRESGKIEASVHSYRSAIRQRPNYPEAHNNLANTYFELGKIDSAIASYRRALQFSPDYSQARYNYAAVLQWIGRLDQAVEEYELVLRTQPNNAEARANLEKTLGRLKKRLRE